MGLLSFCTFFLSGAYAILLLERLPTDGWLYAGLILTFLCLAIRPMRPVGSLLLGFILMWVTSRSVLAQRLPTSLVGEDIISSFQIIDFVSRKGHSASLVVSPINSPISSPINSPISSGELPPRIRLSWFDAAEALRIGDCWELNVRLRRPRGFSNPAGFDYEGWLFRESIGATGYVRKGRRLDQCDRLSWVTSLRRQSVDRLAELLPDDAATAVLMAITVGARHKIDDGQWQQYAITGTSHLMAISGLHIGLAAGGGFLLSWCLMALCNRSGNLHDQAAVIAMLIAACYAALSGFAVPAQRAMLMLVLVGLARMKRRQLAPMHILAGCCIVMTMADALTILAPGFQLSFTAVAILFWVATLHRTSRTSRSERSAGYRLQRIVLEIVPLQFALFFGLLPLTAVLFDRVSWLAPFMNLLALPIFNLVTVPAALLGLLFTGGLAPLGDGLIFVAWQSVSILLKMVAIAAQIPHANLRVADLEGIVLATTSLAILWAILPASWPGRKLAWIATLGSLLHEAPPPTNDCVQINILDVGQGLATVVRTKRHTMVFDTGPSFRSGSDTGHLVLVPFLRNKGIDRVDLLVVSHGDNDHAGGVQSLIAQVHVETVITGEHLAGLERQQSLCAKGQEADWDGIRISLLHPSVDSIREGNNSSCVVEIRTGDYVALMTGDIELPVEQQLVREGKLSRAELVIVPHHGSRTSSHAAFVKQLQPRVAVISAGYGNRWGFPKNDIVARWQSVGSEVINTATAGAISYRMCAKSGLQLLEMHRRDDRRIWNAPPALE